MKYYTAVRDLILVVLAAVIPSISSFAAPSGNKIEFQGKLYNLDSHTLLLDRENILGIEGSYRDALEAFAAVSASGVGKTTLLIAPSVYWLDNPDDPEIRKNPDPKQGTPYAVELKCDTLEIIGMAADPQDVVLAVNRGQTQGALGNYTMFHFFGKSLKTENITFGNYCNLDLIYPRNASFNREKRKDAIVQAQIGICEGTDRFLAQNCRFLSRLNLCPFVGGRRSLYNKCYFECTDDALTGSAVYLDCGFTFFSSKPFYSTAETGAVFLNCDIKCLTGETQYLTKAPGAVAMIDTRFTCDHSIDIRWTRDASDVVCFQSNVTLNGKPLKIDSDRPHLWADITNLPLLAAYKASDGEESVYNIPWLMGGGDGWDPLDSGRKVEEIERRSGISGKGIPIGLRLGRAGKERNLEAKGDTLRLRVDALRWGGYVIDAPDGAYNWDIPNGLKGELTDEGVLLTSANHFPEKIEATVRVVDSKGLKGGAKVTVKPYLKEGPVFKEKPIIMADKKTKSLRVNYRISGDSRDVSKITWYRSGGHLGRDTVAVRHGSGEEGAVYPLCPDDEGCMISVGVTAARSDSYSGETTTAEYLKIIGRKEIPTRAGDETLCTSFKEIPIRKRSASEGATRKGVWTFDAYKPQDTSGHDWEAEDCAAWYYGRGADAATGEGIVQYARGARLSYSPLRGKKGGMAVSLIAEPCKSAGQGFGSATSQYMDICLKFNQETLDGYALRIERTPDHDRAVTFSLVKYERGEARHISEKIVSDCFRNPCDIKVGIDGSTLWAKASTGAGAARKCCDEVSDEVSLSAEVEPSEETGFCIQHTGSTGASATLLRDLELRWSD